MGCRTQEYTPESIILGSASSPKTNFSDSALRYTPKPDERTARNKRKARGTSPAKNVEQLKTNESSPHTTKNRATITSWSESQQGCSAPKTALSLEISTTTNPRANFPSIFFLSNLRTNARELNTCYLRAGEPSADWTLSPRNSSVLRKSHGLQLRFREMFLPSMFANGTF